MRFEKHFHLKISVSEHSASFFLFVKSLYCGLGQRSLSHSPPPRYGGSLLKGEVKKGEKEGKIEVWWAKKGNGKLLKDKFAVTEFVKLFKIWHGKAFKIDGNINCI